MKNKRIIIIISIIIILVLILGFVLIKKYSKQENKEPETILESEIVFTPTEEYLANKIKTELKKQNYIDSSNTKRFEITKFQQYGYFKSEPNIRYIIVSYEFECQDGTTNCINIPYTNVSDNNTLKIVIDLNDKNYLKFQSGFSSTIDQIDDLVQDYTMPEYKDLKS